MWVGVTTIYSPPLRQFAFSPDLTTMKTLLFGILGLAFLCVALAEGNLDPTCLYSNINSHLTRRHLW